ncbi:peptide ABC transporter substrate-binding protein [Anaeroselena agilis]|uniref:Peptide ABC transporter substrate-binding protein n=1 Tax=Anaeroselena agilis TaxID=3063788 RepID=A0ABU3NZ38_9FIRM|nr:peptide ABC transporter substrate-binding protein [Selenomonadales bacterium 4137-cl]
MAKKTTALILAIVLAATFILSGCSWFGAKKDAKYLRYAVAAEPETLDPRKATSIPAGIIQAQLFEGLTALDAASSPVPAAAERWEISPDGLTYTFHLRKGAKWSNGEPVTAADFEYAWKSALSPELASSYAYQLFCLKNGRAYNEKKAAAAAVGVKALGDDTLEVALERPTPYFLSLVAFRTFYPVSRNAAANQRWAADAKTFVGNGPFRLTNWVHDNKMELVRNEHYWDAGKVRMDKVDIVLVDSAATRLVMFENKQLDMADSPPVSEIPRLQKEGKLKIFPFLGVSYFPFNVKKAPFNDARVRKAFTLALDRRSLVDRVARGGQTPALAFVPPGIADAGGKDFRAKGGQYFADNDTAAAKKLLAEAGYPEGKGLPPITLLYNTSESNKLIAEAVQEMWKRTLGVTVQLSNQELKVFYDNLDKHNFQVAIDSWIGDYIDPMTFLELFETANGNNSPGYANPAYDSHLTAARQTSDVTTRSEAFHAAEKILLADAVVLPVYFSTSPVMVRPNVRNQIRTVLGIVYLKQAYLE